MFIRSYDNEIRLFGYRKISNTDFCKVDTIVVLILDIVVDQISAYDVAIMGSFCICIS